MRNMPMLADNRQPVFRLQLYVSFLRCNTFGLSDGRAIDGSRSGNSARCLNHACTPNCEALDSGDRIFIHALADIAPGCELFIDCAPAIDGEPSDETRLQYTCH